MTALAENINSEILGWAREEAGFSLEEAAKKFGFKDSKKNTAVERLKAIEQGKESLTRNQLFKIAEIYRRPLITFYLSKPPIVTDKGEDYRRLSNALGRREKGILNAILRNVKARQEMVHSIIEEQEDSETLNFINSIKINEPIKNVVKKLNSFLDYEKQPAKAKKDADEKFRYLRKQIEKKGVFVLLIGDLGSHHTNISTSVFRGFAISDKLAPFIIINPNDSKSARCFTLIHELVHLFVGSTGISGLPNVSNANNQNSRLERFCNDVASEFLLPDDIIAEINVLSNFNQARKKIDEIAGEHGVSKSMIAYRCQRKKIISKEYYERFIKEYLNIWKFNKERERKKITDRDSGGPSHHVIHRHRIGNGLLELVGQSLRIGELTHSKAAILLGSRINAVEPLLSGVPAIYGTYEASADR